MSIRMVMNTDFVNASSLGDASIYEGGNVGEIKLKEIVGNEIAIKQLINDRNIKAQEVLALQSENEKISKELGFLRTSPAFAYFSAAVNIVGSVFMCFGGGTNSDLKWLLIIGGAILVLIADCQITSHNRIYNWFNRS